MISYTEQARTDCSFHFFLIGLIHWVRRGFQPLAGAGIENQQRPAPSWRRLLLAALLIWATPLLLVRLLPAPHTPLILAAWLLGMVFLASYGVWTLLHLIICATSSFYQARCQEGRALARMRAAEQPQD